MWAERFTVSRVFAGVPSPPVLVVEDGFWGGTGDGVLCGGGVPELLAEELSRDLRGRPRPQCPPGVVSPPGRTIRLSPGRKYPSSPGRRNRGLTLRAAGAELGVGEVTEPKALACAAITAELTTGLGKEVTAGAGATAGARDSNALVWAATTAWLTTGLAVWATAGAREFKAFSWAAITEELMTPGKEATAGLGEEAAGAVAAGEAGGLPWMLSSSSFGLPRGGGDMI